MVAETVTSELWLNFFLSYWKGERQNVRILWCVCICVKHSYPSVSATVICMWLFTGCIKSLDKNNVYKNKAESKNIKDYFVVAVMLENLVVSVLKSWSYC